MKKRIAIINSVFGIGSTGRICSDFQAFCNNEDYDAYVFYGRGPKSNKTKKQFNFSLPLSVKIHWLFSRIFDCSGFLSFFSTKKLINQLKRIKPDIIFINNLHGYFLNIALFLKYLSRSASKNYFVLHDCWLFTGHCAYFTYEKCEKWKIQCKECALKKSYPRSIIFDRSKSNFNYKKKLFQKLNGKVTLITPSRWLAELVSNSFLKEFPVKVINNGIDTSLFKPSVSDFKIRYSLENRINILTIANIWDKRKGLDDVIKLSNIISKEFVITLVGKIPCGTKLPKNIVHIDQTNNIQDLINIYSSSDIFFNPSHEDNYPTVNLEALACSVPIICYNCCGTPESVDPNFVVSEGDIESVYELIKLLTNNQIQYNFSLNKHISKNDTYKKYFELIENGK